jgi:hypothetical protein
MDVPVTGTNATAYDQPGSWQVSTSYRWQKSDRHFVGSDEQEERQAESSEVINRIHLVDVSVRYNATRRTSLSLGLPYLMAERSGPIRDASRHVIDRSVTQARGLSDVTLTARRFMFDPASCKNGNVSLGLGVKVPTGDASHLDVRRTFEGGQIVSSIQPVDQSIQPGDGGWGFLLEGTAFRRFGGRFAAYASGAYLFNPEETSHTQRGGTNPITRELSIADQYLGRVGLAATFRRGGSWTTSLGGRLEGVPAEDRIGGSNGFRRPGYAVSLEPGITYRRGRNAITAGVPVALYRNRTRSVADMASGGHGDAAFADYLVILGYSRSFP